MQIKYLHKSVYHVRGIDETEYSAEVYQRVHAIESYRKLKQQGISEQIIFETLQVSRATMYRWIQRYDMHELSGLVRENTRPNRVRVRQWSSALEQAVLRLRRQHPLYGKYKIAVLLKRERCFSTSSSTVGRILTALIKREAVKAVRFYYGHARDKKKRIFNNHAKRWRYGMNAEQVGEMIGVDHMVTILASGEEVRHFQAICPITKLLVAQTYTCATSKVAAHFLEHMMKRFPFKIKSIKVDGGSEFMGEFETGCKRAKISLYVLPPRSPKYNGHVERSNCTVKYEFYEQYDGPTALGLLRLQLHEYVDQYNRIRPHQALQYRTPSEYYSTLRAQ